MRRSRGVTLKLPSCARVRCHARSRIVETREQPISRRRVPRNAESNDSAKRGCRTLTAYCESVATERQIREHVRKGAANPSWNRRSSSRGNVWPCRPRSARSTRPRCAKKWCSLHPPTAVLSSAHSGARAVPTVYDAHSTRCRLGAETRRRERRVVHTCRLECPVNDA